MKYVTNSNRYTVDKSGNVYCNKNKKYLKSTINSQGYVTVSLFINNKWKCLYVHRLVAEAFIPNPENKLTVNHRNGIKTDNNLNNLEWNTYSENHKHAYRKLKRIPSKAMLGVLGKDNKLSKKVNQYTKEGSFIKTWDCIRDVERNLGINNSHIVQVCKGKMSSIGGFKWEYA